MGGLPLLQESGADADTALTAAAKARAANLSRRGLGAHHARALSAALIGRMGLPAQAQLRVLNLAGNVLRDEGAGTIAGALCAEGCRSARFCTPGAS